MATDACVVLVTCGSLGEAETIAKTVVQEHLAACANILGGSTPVKSFYFWQGALNEDSEHLLVIKTAQAVLPLLEARIKTLHSYTVPEFIALPILCGSAEYLDWIYANTISG